MFCLYAPSHMIYDKPSSKRGEGVFTMGICTYSFLPIEAVSCRPHELYAKAKATVERLAKEDISSGLLEQYKIQLERLEPGKNQPGPGCEIIFASGFLCPSKYLMSDRAWWKRLTVFW